VGHREDERLTLARALQAPAQGEAQAERVELGNCAWLLASLPALVKTERCYEADFYGASSLVANALGLNRIPPSVASWTHGPAAWWMPLRFPQQVAFHRHAWDRCLVVTREQEQFLREQRYPRVHAVGAPILYVPEFELPRRPGSLLVMPGHTLYNNDHHTPYQAYAEYIASMRARFETVVTCLHANDVAKNRWAPAFEAVGIPWVRGADSFDRNSLLRVVSLMKQFEFVTSNALGSHIPYAAYFGAKTSLAGPRASVDAADMRNARLYKENPELLAFTLSATQEFLKRGESPFQVNPWDAVEQIEFGKSALGLDARRSPGEVARLLGWNLTGRAELAVRSSLAWAGGVPGRVWQRLTAR
jgi:hypothetical protein